MYKRLYLSLSLCCCCTLIFSQSATPSVLGVGGGSVTQSGYRIDYNIGELAIKTAGTNPMITEGFEQPEMGEAALPVIGLKLRVTQEGNHAILSFSTVQEFKTDHFIAERSSDGLHFDTLAIIKTKAPNGYSMAPLYYTYQDPGALNATTLYYRIAQVDQNGAYMYSSVISISGHKQNTLKVFPNPATSQLTVYIGNPVADTRVRVYSSSGSLMYSKKVASKQEVTIQLGGWSAGIYLLVVDTNGEIQKTKFIKK